METLTAEQQTMELQAQKRRAVIEAVDTLSIDALQELLLFIEYLKFKTSQPLLEAAQQPSNGSKLSAITAICEADADDIAERDEEILAAEIDPISGWSLTPSA